MEEILYRNLYNYMVSYITPKQIQEKFPVYSEWCAQKLHDGIVDIPYISSYDEMMKAHSVLTDERNNEYVKNGYTDYCRTIDTNCDPIKQKIQNTWWKLEELVTNITPLGKNVIAVGQDAELEFVCNYTHLLEAFNQDHILVLELIGIILADHLIIDLVKEVTSYL